MAEILYGAPVSDAISDDLRLRVSDLRQKGITPTLAIIRIGEKKGDISYEKGAAAQCESVGAEVKRIVLPENISQDELLEVIEDINSDKLVHGCLLLRPLPNGIDEREICEALSCEKDVDCIGSRSLGSVFTGENIGFPPCTAEACLAILAHYGIEIAGKLCIVIGRSLVIGKPVSMLMQAKDATVIMCHSKTENLKELCKSADIIISAAGNLEFIDDSFVSEKQVIIDVGINFGKDRKMHGDVNFEKASPLVSALTPVPGGVGKVTSAILAKHLVEAAERL